jgi:leucyl aminopeptidase
MKFHINSKPTPESIKHLDIVFLPVWLSKENKAESFGGFFSELSQADQKLVQSFLRERQIKPGESHVIRLNDTPSNVFLATENSFTEKKVALSARRFTRRAKYDGYKTAGFFVDDYEKENISGTRTASIVSENALLAHYDFSEQYKTAPKEGWRHLSSFVLFTLSDVKGLKSAVSGGELIAEAVNECRTLANFPPSELKPEGMAEAARDVARQYSSVKVTVFDEKKLKQEGMNAILAVGAGSASAPRLICLEYSGDKKGSKPLALVGKGVTFDSGGLNLKPGDHMADMHMDMSGGASVIYAIKAIAGLKLPINVIGLVPAVENMPSGLSYRQGDIVKAYGGKTIEIGNTDAEGRVILADAIEYAKTKKPELIVTIATLTGAVMVALGTKLAGLFVKDKLALSQALVKIGKDSGDAVWPMPLNEDFEREVEGNLADVINTQKNGSRWGGASHGAAFLSHFAGKENFAHIDMAPRMTANPDEEL